MTKLAHVSKLCLLLIPALLLSGCKQAPSSAVAPEIKPYSAEFQKQAGEELKALKPPCAPDVANMHCSATHRLVVDYGHTRDQIRAQTAN